MKLKVLIVGFLLAVPGWGDITSVGTFAAGSNGQVQYNDRNDFGASSNLTYSTTTLTLMAPVMAMSSITINGVAYTWPNASCASGYTLNIGASNSIVCTAPISPVGGGGASSLAVNLNGVKVTSPTVAVNAVSPLIVTSVGGGTTAQISVDVSSFTLNGPLSAQAPLLLAGGAFSLDKSSVTLMGPDPALGGALSGTISNAVLNLVDISAKTNLAVNAPITLTGDIVGIDKSSVTLLGPSIDASELPADGYASTYVNTVGDTMTGQLTVSGSSITATGSGGVRATYGISGGSLTARNLASTLLAVDANGVLISTTVVIPVAGAAMLGISSGSATNSVVVSSPTSNVVYDSHTFIVSLQGATSSFVQVKGSSVTLHGENVILLQSTPQGASSVFNVSSGTASNMNATTMTVTGDLIVGDDATVAGGLTVSGGSGVTIPTLTINRCVETDGSGRLTSASAACGTGSGSGGASSLAVNQNGVQITSPTVAINALSPPFKISSVGGGTTAQWTLDFSSVASRGDVILKQTTLQSGATFYVSSGTVATAFITNGSVVHKTPISINQPGTGVVNSAINFSQQGTTAGSIQQLYYGGTGFSSPLLLRSPVEASFTHFTNAYVDSEYGFSVITGSNSPSSLSAGMTLGGPYDFSVSTQGYTSVSSIHWPDGTVQVSSPSASGGSGDVLLASTQTFTGKNTFQNMVTISTAIAGVTRIQWSDGTVQVTSPTAGGGSSTGIVSPGTFTWTNTQGIVVSTFSATGAIDINNSASPFSRLQFDPTASSPNMIITAYNPVSSSNQIIFNDLNDLTYATLNAGSRSPSASGFTIAHSSCAPVGNKCAPVTRWTFNNNSAQVFSDWTGATIFQASAPLTASQFVKTDASKNLVSYDLLNATQTWTGGNTFSSMTVTTLNGVTPGLIAGTNITSITGAWPNQTINATTQGGGGTSSLAVTTGTSSGFNTVISSPTGVMLFNGSQMIVTAQGNATAYMTLDPSSVTLQGNNLATTYLTNSSATATYLQSSSATVTYLQKSSATATYGQFSANQTWTGQNNWTTSAQSTFTYGVTVGSLTISGSGNPSYTVPQDGSTLYQFVGSSITPTVGHLAVYSSSHSIIDGGAVPTSGGSGSGTINASTQYQIPFYSVSGSSNVLNSSANFTNNGTTITITGAYTEAITNLSTVTYSGVYFDATASTMTLGYTSITSSMTISGSGGLKTTYGAVLGSATVNDLTASQLVRTDANKKLVSSATLTTSELVGVLAAAQHPAITGDITTSAGSLATTAAASQANIKTFTSSITVTGVGGLSVTYGAIVGSSTVNDLTASQMVRTDANKKLISSATLTTTELVGVLAAAQHPALTGDITTTAGSLATTATALQNNIKTFTSSITVTNAAGFLTTGPVLASSATLSSTVVSTGTFVIKSTTSLAILSVDNTLPVAGDFMLAISSVPGATPGAAGSANFFGVNTYGHVVSSGTAPTVSSCGTSPSVDSNSTDLAMVINTGSASPTACTITFANAFVNAPVCVVTDDLQTAEPAVTSRSTTAITVTLSAALNSGHLFIICVGAKG